MVGAGRASYIQHPAAEEAVVGIVLRLLLETERGMSHRVVTVAVGLFDDEVVEGSWGRIAGCKELVHLGRKEGKVAVVVGRRSSLVEEEGLGVQSDTKHHSGSWESI